MELLLDMPTQNTKNKQLMHRLDGLRLPLDEDTQKKITREISRVK